jgi:hypothetical protein
MQNEKNAPERFLSWRWEDESEEYRLEFKSDSRRPNAGTFTIFKEDHSLGNKFLFCHRITYLNK